MYPRDKRGGLARLASESTALAEIASVFALQKKLQKHAAPGEDRPVLLIPGFTATDRLMGRLRRFLNDCGYDAHGWGQGRNMGVRQDLLDGFNERVAELAHSSGQKVSLIGWSGGGMYARASAASQPEVVRQVITMGTPFKLTEDKLDYLPEGIYRLHERLSPRDSSAVEEIDNEQWLASPPVPSSSLYSERDALSPWPFCIDVTDGQSENLHVPGSHAAMPYNPLMYYVIADRLAQPEGEWRPFALNGPRRLLFRSTCARDFGWDH